MKMVMVFHNIGSFGAFSQFADERFRCTSTFQLECRCVAFARLVTGHGAPGLWQHGVYRLDCQHAQELSTTTTVRTRVLLIVYLAGSRTIPTPYSSECLCARITR